LLTSQFSIFDPDSSQDVFELANVWGLKKPSVFVAHDGPLSRLLHLVDDQLALIRELRGGLALSKQCTKMSSLDLIFIAGANVRSYKWIVAHGLRLIDQTSAEHAVMSAAIARTAGGSRMNMGVSESRRPPMFLKCSL
jgi:hypothetical protein